MRMHTDPAYAVSYGLLRHRSGGVSLSYSQAWPSGRPQSQSPCAVLVLLHARLNGPLPVNSGETAEKWVKLTQGGIPCRQMQVGAGPWLNSNARM